MRTPDASAIAEMRTWLADLGFADLTAEELADPEQVTDDDVVTAVDRLYAGGLTGFLSTCPNAAPEVTR